MSAIGRAATFALLLAVGAATAQESPPSVRDLSTVERQAKDFYGAIAGRKNVTTEWAVSTSMVTLDGECLLTLIVKNATNPHELTRPGLASNDDFLRHFQVSDEPDAPTPEAATEARFAYRLHPRTVGAIELPTLMYRFYRGGKFYSAPVAPITITVTPAAPKPTPVAPAVPIEAPEEFFTLAPERRSSSLLGIAWVLPILLTPFVVAAWVVGWRRLFPDAARLAKLRRNRAARIAIDRLRAASTAPDPSAVAAMTVRGYLGTRFGILPTAQTPAEVAAALQLIGRPDSMVTDVEHFLRNCDAARFANFSDTGLSLVAEAERLIVEWEGAAE